MGTPKVEDRTRRASASGMVASQCVERWYVAVILILCVGGMHVLVAGVDSVALTLHSRWADERAASPLLSSSLSSFALLSLALFPARGLSDLSSLSHLLPRASDLRLVTVAARWRLATTVVLQPAVLITFEGVWMHGISFLFV